jgi:poly-gamma-glutamate capsule biosynthesis protein CapA/YwtB (metallophosphatase superfamily)
METSRQDHEPLGHTRRRHVRRSRVVLALAIAVVAVASTLVLSTTASDTPARAAAQKPAAAAPARSLLGSGKSVTLAFGGDVHFESPIRERLAASSSSVLAPMAHVLSRADIAMVNLETAVTDRGEPAPKQFVFRAPASAFSALESGGVDLVTVANNHGMDYGTTGLKDTLTAGRHVGVPVIGAGWNDKQAYAPHRVNVRGQRIAIIAATQVLDDNLVSAWTAGPGKMGLASAKDEPRLVRAVREARRASDTVVVYLHWGVELVGCPTGNQTSLARKLVDAGADIVVGSHAHVLLGAGKLKHALVDYGLGNFVFYASREVTSQSGVLEVTVTGRRIDRYRWTPARISAGIPHPTSGSASSHARAHWRSLRSCTNLKP